jgi:hypothetical protein
MAVYGLAFFAKVQWEISVLPVGWGWVLAIVVGYGVNYFLGNRGTGLLWMLGLNGVLLGSILAWLWTTLPAGQWAYNIAFNFGIIFLYVRSARFIYQVPTRTQMLLRFEGNVIFYMVFVLMGQAHPAMITGSFHVLFLIALVLSLIGMVLTLYPDEEQQQHGDSMETRVVGEGQSLSLILGVILIACAGIGLLLLIPAVQAGLISLVTGGWGVLTWAGSAVLSALGWLLSLIPPPEPVEMPAPEGSPRLDLPEGAGGGQGDMSVIWLVMILAILFIIILVWISSMLMRNWKPVAPVRMKRSKVRRVSIWSRLYGWLLGLVKRWKMRFPRYYSLRIYWYYYLMSKWAAKNGYPRLGHETPGEYVRRLCDTIPFDQEIKDRLQRLGAAYSAAYYSGGKVIVEEDFDFEQLRELFVKKVRSL